MDDLENLLGKRPFQSQGELRNIDRCACCGPPYCSHMKTYDVRKGCIEECNELIMWVSKSFLLLSLPLSTYL